MINDPIKEINIASGTEVKQTAHDFASALAETQPFKNYEQATLRFHQDASTQKDMQEYREKQQSLRPQMKKDAVNPTDQAELEHLHDAWLAHATVLEYLEAQEELVAFCQSLGDLLTEMLGLDFPGTCVTSCCG